MTAKVVHIDGGIVVSRIAFLLMETGFPKAMVIERESHGKLLRQTSQS